jgi:hypothetical protein
VTLLHLGSSLGAARADDNHVDHSAIAIQGMPHRFAPAAVPESPVMRRFSTAVVLSSFLLAAPTQAQRSFEPAYTPSAFSYGFHGFLLGGTAGLGAGYLAGQAGGWHDGDWRALAYGAGIGALLGGGLGVGLGISDMAAQTPARAYFILRDGGYGLGFGAVAGSIAGGLAALSSHQGAHVLVGASIGALAGTAAGLVLGVVEGQRWRGRTVAWLSLVAASAADGTLHWIPALEGRY